MEAKPNPYRESYFAVMSEHDFIIGKDDFKDLSIKKAPERGGFHFFENRKKSYVKRFVLKQTDKTEKVCIITLIKSKDGKFEPRFLFKITDVTNKKILEVRSKANSALQAMTKAQVSLDDVHEEFNELLGFIKQCADIQLSAEQYSVVSSKDKIELDKFIATKSKDEVLRAFISNFGDKVTEKDIAVLTKRKEALERFEKLLNSADYFEQFRAKLSSTGKSARPEDVWQTFFQDQKWIFGYGLQLVACENLDMRKFETTVVGNDIFDGGGKRIDALLKTRGKINSTLFTELKRHDLDLVEQYESRPDVFVPSKDLRGAIAQVQKTIHKVQLKLGSAIHRPTDKLGNPTGEELAYVQPKGIVVMGMLDQFVTENGMNEEQFSSFEIYRKKIHGIEILTYDELLERARYIIKE